MKCVVIPINRSDYTFESSFSAIVRSYELFKPGKIIILHAEFNKVHLQKLHDLFNELRGNGIEVKCRLLDKASYEDFKKLIEEETKGCEKTYLVPTSGANIVAAYLGILHTQNGYPLVNYLFSFGPWTRYYYPFVPRSLEKASIIGDSISNDVKLDLKLESYLSNTTFTRIIEDMAKRLNEEILKEEDDLVLKIKGNTALTTVSPDYSRLIKEIKTVLRNLRDKGDEIQSPSDKELENQAKSILSLAGAYDILTADGNKSIEEISYGRTVLIDTNLIYYGIHTHEIRDIVIPYCVHNEILWNVNEKEKFRDAVFHVYEALREKVRMVPSESTICDVAIPKIEPDLIKGSLVLTGDKRAYDRWKKLAISSYTDIMLVKLGGERKDYVSVSSVIFNLAAILYLIGLHDVEVCWKNYGCVSP